MVAGAGFEPATFDGMKALRSAHGEITVGAGQHSTASAARGGAAHGIYRVRCPQALHPGVGGRTVGSSANSGSRMNGERSSSFWRDVSRAPRSRWRRWATPTLHRRSTNDQALRLRPRPDPAREHQLLDVDHGNVVRTAHRNERRLAVPAEPNVGAALADRQAL